MSRGIDFESDCLALSSHIDVSGVINYCMPASVDNYIHRIGRTARAENLGTALSFIQPNNEKDHAILTEIQKRNAPRNGHPVPQCLPFDIKEIESFTYRWACVGVLMSSVEDVKRGITRNLIKETRVMELRREALNSNKLKMHFEDNPQELQLLKHAASKKLLRVQPHLKDIPEYLVPEALKPKVTIREESGKRSHSNSVSGNEWKRKKVDDPLHVGVGCVGDE